MVGFTLSVAALLMFLWVVVRRHAAAAAGELPLQGGVPRGLAAREGGGRPDGGREHRQGEAEGARAGRALDGRRRWSSTTGSRRSARDAHAILRQKSLLGETYVEITPGTAGAPKLADGGTLPSAQVDNSVELDEVFRVFDPDDAQGVPAVAPRGRASSRPGRSRATSTTRSGTRRRSSRAAPTCCGRWPSRRWRSGACSATPAACSTRCRARTASCSGLITNGNATFGALASRDDALAETFQIFPTFLRETRATVRRLEAFAKNTDPLVRDLAQPARDLAPTLRDLGALSPDLEHLFNHIHPLVRASKTGVPAATRFLKGAEPVLEATHVFMPELNPILSYLSFARVQLAQFITVGGAALAGNGEGGYQRASGVEHYLPQIAIIDGRSVAAPHHAAGVGAGELVHRAERLRPRGAAGRDRGLRLQARRAASSATRRATARPPRRRASRLRRSSGAIRSSRACNAERRRSCPLRRAARAPLRLLPKRFFRPPDGVLGPHVRAIQEK